MNPPRATYRLQLNKDFTFADATALVPYLDRLGVSHAYLSPILKAQPGSTHGYDTVDHSQINPELGTLDDFRVLARALQARGMGILLDFVPNHMGVGGAENRQWLDVLRHGPGSRYAEWFDIDWQPSRPGMNGKILLPFLGKPYAEVLAEGDICLKADDEGLSVWAYGKEKLPIRPEDYAALVDRHGSEEGAVAAHATPSTLDSLIQRQHWRLAHFASAAGEINYRRFFIHSELAGIRIERSDVFDHAHRLIFALIEEGLVEGLRIDHIDGLCDPLDYLRSLRRKSPRPIYLAIEKILAPHESLRRDWPVDGTTGYEIGAELARLLTRWDGEAVVTKTYETFAGPITPAAEEIYRCKLRVLDNELAAELHGLAAVSARLAWSAPASADLTEIALRQAWREVIAKLDVYRTYVDMDRIHERDRREIGLALRRARRSQIQIQPAVFAFVEKVLCGGLSAGYARDLTHVVQGRFQQLSGPAMAKGLEDTALYRCNRLVSLNEVGARPDRFSMSIAAFHDSNCHRLRAQPRCMLATTTHDTKRGEDSRMIIAAIADDPERWARAVAAWTSILAESARALHPNDLYLFFQLLLGSWSAGSSAEMLVDRLDAAMIKSLREARQRSDWGVNNVGYELSVGSFVRATLENDRFLASFHAARAGFEQVGRRKSLIQTALKLTIPGIPDIYRGAEDWEQSLVDPDNRRPVDFHALERRLAAPEATGDEKLILTRDLLHFRRQNPALLLEGEYEPLDLGADILAFRRRQGALECRVLADLSPGHARGFPDVEAWGAPIAGSCRGPIWITYCRDS